jgi:hypothetical protein
MDRRRDLKLKNSEVQTLTVAEIGDTIAAMVPSRTKASGIDGIIPWIPASR